MRVAIRADADVRTGSGHVMRCLSLADALRRQGADVTFITRALPAALAAWVGERGHAVAALPAREPQALPAGPGDEIRDAGQTLALATGADWMVVDHYQLGAAWETAARAGHHRVLAIDDLARPHDCDLLLDQNLHAAPEARYRGRVPPGCVLLLGPRHALLREGFAEARRKVAPRSGPVRRLHVFLGGMDADNVTTRVLHAIAAAGATHLPIDVVLGAQHPAKEALQALTATWAQTRCHVQTPDMVELLCRADLAIGAGGSSTWERCALGVPTLALCVADNQRELLRQASAHGLLATPDEADQRDVAALAAHVRALLGNETLRSQLSARAYEMVDGGGAERVARAMAAPALAVRRARAADCEPLRTWRNAPEVRAVSRSDAIITPEQHRAWFDRVLAADDRLLLICELSGQPVGVVRFDVDATDPECAEVSIYLVPGHQGRGLGGPVLHAAESWLRRSRPQLTWLRAHVRAGNAASRRLFEASGYAVQSCDYLKRISTT
jgi:UDP-2,4-diacetamido-2,4,6-trideoxy-beta-L-altropyranose hydrolase